MATLANSTYGTISDFPPLDDYASLKIPIVGSSYCLTDPLTPVRTSPKRKLNDPPPTMAEIDYLDDGAPLGTVLQFGHPFSVSDLGKSYMGVTLPTHGGDPVNQAWKLAFEQHKARQQLTADEVREYTVNPSAAVVARPGVYVIDLLTMQEHLLPFGSRIHNLENDQTFTIGSGENARRFQIVDVDDVKGMAGLGRVTSQGITLAEHQRRVSAFRGQFFLWGFGDASSWIGQLFGSYGVHLPHNTARMDAALRQGAIPGATEILHFSDLDIGHIVFLGPKGRDKPINFMGMVEKDEHGKLCLRCVGGKKGWMGYYISNQHQLLSETQIIGYPPTAEIKAAWDVVKIHP